ncbi:MAG: hypothetical protein Q4E17_04865 [Synergistes sp.]|nr:hypothetical protein [Synergistes sp.]
MPLQIFTGFFVWDAWQWMRVFTFSAFVFICATCYVVMKRGYCTLPSSLKEIDRKTGYIAYICSVLSDSCVRPWACRPYISLLGIAALVILFAAALFTR